MALYTLRHKDFSFEDYRGSLTQLIHDGFKQVNVLMTKADVIRGGHYHEICNEAFYVISGKVETTLRKIGDNNKETITFCEGDFFEIHPFTIHSMSFPEDCLMIQLYDVPVEFDDGTKDIISEEI